LVLPSFDYGRNLVKFIAETKLDIDICCPLWDLKSTKRTITLHSLKIMESFDNRFTSHVDFNYCERKITGYMGLPIQ
jgi:hypothetical protein